MNAPASYPPVDSNELSALRSMAAMVAVKGPLLLALLDEIDAHRAVARPPDGYANEERRPMSQDALMIFDPATGESHPYPSHAAQWRKHCGYYTAWLFNPWTGERRDARDVGSDVTGQLIVPPDEQLRSRSLRKQMVDGITDPDGATPPLGIIRGTPGQPA